MHLYVLTRGIKHEVDKWVDECSHTFWAYGPADTQVQLALRPIQLWEIVFPKIHLQSVLATIGGGSIDKQDFSKKILGASFRKFLGASKVPEFDMTKVPVKAIISQDVSGAQIIKPAVNNYCVGVDWIGVREDVIWPDGQYKGYEQL